MIWLCVRVFSVLMVLSLSLSVPHPPAGARARYLIAPTAHWMVCALSSTKKVRWISNESACPSATSQLTLHVCCRGSSADQLFSRAARISRGAARQVRCAKRNVYSKPFLDSAVNHEDDRTIYECLELCGCSTLRCFGCSSLRHSAGIRRRCSVADDITYFLGGATGSAVKVSSLRRGVSMVSKSYLPYYAAGKVVKGFGRGSKSLGCPTANFPEEIVEALPKEFETGIYYGWASLDREIYKMVMSIGWNPFYHNDKKSMEIHLIHKFDSDFYGKELKAIILGYIRPEKNFSSVDELISAIQNDIEVAKQSLDEPHNAKYKGDPFFIS